MHATKETFVITIAAAVLALGLSWIWERWIDASSKPARECKVNWTHVAAGSGVWILVWLLLFSSFFTNASGLLDSVRTYFPWLHRAGGASPHINPWHFYLHRLLFFHVAKGPIWSEAVILVLAVIAAGAAFARKGLTDGSAKFIRFLSLYTFILMAAYCLISYKTPWCLLNFWHGMILLAGVGAAVVIRTGKNQATRAAAGVLVVAGVAQLSCQAWQASVTYPADRRNPYVYAQTSPNLLELAARVKALENVHPQHNSMLVKVMAPDGDYWPLPWYLRELKQVGWWDQVPPEPFAPVMIVSAQFRANFDEKKTHVMTGLFELRPNVFFELYVELELWKAFLASSGAAPKQAGTARPE
jgi:predicted membrane-bound mannosyltransferase